MPTTPYAKLFLSINGGSLTSGGVTVDAEDELQLSPESTVGWDRPATVYQITAYPSGWSTPTGWTLNGTSGYIEYHANGSNGVTPPAIAMPTAGQIAGGIWGKWKFRLLVNGGGGQLTDWDSGVLIVSPGLGLRSVARGERGEFGGILRNWAGEIQHDLKVLEDALGFVTGDDMTLAAGGDRVISVDQLSGTGTNVGDDITIKAGKGQQQTGGANNNNGGLALVKGGDPGTGGSGTAGVAGDAAIESGTLRLAVQRSVPGLVLYDTALPSTPALLIDIANARINFLGCGLLVIPTKTPNPSGLGSGKAQVLFNGTDLVLVLPDGTAYTLDKTPV
jgi:hypothetical protein